jgi:hypothetical protein
MKGAVNNPAIAATFAILISTGVGSLILLAQGDKSLSVQPKTQSS